MNLFRNVVFIAAIAGLVAGVVLACLQAYATVPLILKAEVYEQAGGGHHHDHAAPAATDTSAMSTAAPIVVSRSPMWSAIFPWMTEPSG